MEEASTVLSEMALFAFLEAVLEETEIVGKVEAFRLGLTGQELNRNNISEGFFGFEVQESVTPPLLNPGKWFINLKWGPAQCRSNFA